MSTLYESNPQQLDSNSFNGDTWIEQSFTPSSVDHVPTSVKLKLYQSQANSGSVTTRIFLADGDHKPSGTALASGAYPLSSLATGVYTVVESTLDAGAGTLAVGTEYCLVCNCNPSLVTVYHRCSAGAGTYSGGQFGISTNAGTAWTLYSTWDAYFEIWGEPAVSGSSYSYTAEVIVGCYLTYINEVSFTAEALVGATPSATRPTNIYRISSNLVGAVASATKSFVKVVISSVIVGALSTATRLTNWIKTSSTIVGATPSATRPSTSFRLSTNIVGALASATSARNTIRTSPVIVGALPDDDPPRKRIFRTSTNLVGAVATATRVQNIIRTASVIVGAVADAVMEYSGGIVNYVYTATVEVGVVADATRQIVVARVSSAITGLVATATKVRHKINTSSVVVGAVATATRVIQIYRISANSVGALASAIRSINISRIASAIVGAVADATITAGNNFYFTASVVVGVLTEEYHSESSGHFPYTFPINFTGTIDVKSTGRSVIIYRTANSISALSADAVRRFVNTRTSTTIVGVLATATKMRLITASVIVGAIATATRVRQTFRTALNQVEAFVEAIVYLPPHGDVGDSFFYTSETVVGLVATAVLNLYKFRNLTVRVITSQYRHFRIKTSQYRIIHFITNQYRQISLATSNYRLIKTLTTMYRKITGQTKGG